jgi:hypothetical protein
MKIPALISHNKDFLYAACYLLRSLRLNIYLNVSRSWFANQTHTNTNANKHMAEILGRFLCYRAEVTKTNVRYVAEKMFPPCSILILSGVVGAFDRTCIIITA